MNYMMNVRPALEAGNHFKKFMFEKPEHMIVARDVIADMLLFLQDKANVMDDYSNTFEILEMVDGEWIEYEEF